MQDQYLTFRSTPTLRSKGKTHIIIVGAGIIGVCTAYYLTKHPDFNKDTHHITIIESRRVAGGASGKAGGLLALWAFPQQIVPLSFKLHQELSDEYNGEEEWGYRRLTTVSVEGNIEKLLLNDDNEDAYSSHSDSVSDRANAKSTPGTSQESLINNDENNASNDQSQSPNEHLNGKPLQKRRTVTKNSIKQEHL
ncbi:hypothetical protein WICPIJ_003551, partial [Wickerhamomyces pijperi]